MPAVTELDRPNGLPTATTQSPTRSCAVVAEFDGRQRLVALDLEQRDVGSGIGADQLGVEAAPVGQLDGDLLARSSMT